MVYQKFGGINNIWYQFLASKTISNFSNVSPTDCKKKILYLYHIHVYYNIFEAANTEFQHCTTTTHQLYLSVYMELGMCT